MELFYLLKKTPKYRCFPIGLVLKLYHEIPKSMQPRDVQTKTLYSKMMFF